MHSRTYASEAPLRSTVQTEAGGSRKRVQAKNTDMLYYTASILMGTLGLSYAAWSFQPQQRQVHVLPGETALAFYTAKNKSSEDVIGIATYNVTPSKVAPHFNKIQCFCFEEQKLIAGEQVDMPIFFFLDPEFANDPDMADVDTVVLSYTFFKARGMPFEKQPGLAEQHQQQQQ
ncbi:Cytochrome c oxidase assembly protein cox11, mitochondrial [Mortierella alpina]|uniref:Cytochrome c oxidase assembly protein cox11, mitochondrial n=1 Tax=Mortierella alpina TaxID=64518 RepID=A0A9P6M6W2_MORAP|nr:Cytochrome c oxidase assembly protein cox11, mitochondrial [Mortierella alpina]